MKKALMILFVGLLAASSAFAAEKNPRGLSGPRETKKVRSDASDTSKVKDEVKDYKRSKVLGIGINTGYPGTGLVVRYHHDDDHLRAFGIVCFDYSGGFGPSYKTGITIDTTAEYKVYGVPLNDEKTYVLDFGLGGGIGFYIPLTLQDYYTMAFDVGLTVSCDFPKSLPLTPYFRLMYRPNLLFITDDVHMKAFGINASIGCTYNFSL